MSTKTPAPLTEADGHQLLADMLREVSDEWLKYWDGQPEDSGGNTWSDGWHMLKGEVLQRYFKLVSESHSPELRRGFFAALTDFLGQASNGGVNDPEFYEKTPSAWVSK